MRLVRYRSREGERYGALINNMVVCLPSLAKRFKQKLPKRLEDFVASETRCVEKAEKLIENASESDVKRASSQVLMR